MNDLEICKRIAEIEGKEPIEMIQCCVGVWSDADDEFIEFDPLTDDALCFRLMVKYRVALLDEYFTGIVGKWIAEISKRPKKVSEISELPNEAICLAIIEAHNE